jgi:hypothetical protein
MITATSPRRLRLALVAALCLLFTAVGIAPACADTSSSGGDLAVAQTLGERELTVVLRRVTGVPGPLHIDVITHTGNAPGHLALAVTPTGTSTGSASLPAPGAQTDRTGVELGPTPGTYPAAMAVDRPGPWELDVGDGQRVARIPFVVPVQATSPPELAVYGGFLAAGVLLLVTVLVVTRARRSMWALLPAGGLVAALSVAVTGAVLSASLPLPPQPGSQLDPTVDNVTNPYSLAKPLVTDFSRPPVTLTLAGAALSAGQPGDVDLTLTDGATGAPVDDLLVHDSALIHLLVVGPTGQLWHLHPIRTSAGRYQQHLTLPDPGRYAVSAEMVRRGGGVQLVRAAAGLDVTGTPSRTAVAVVTLDGNQNRGSTVVDSTPITVTASKAAAGTPTTVTTHVGDTADLQPWLGMIGHMVVAGPLPTAPGADTAVGTAVQNAQVWAHSHSMGPMAMTGSGDAAGASLSTGVTGMDGMHGMSGMDGMSPMTGTPGTTSMGGMIGVAPVNGDSPPDETVAAYGPDVPFTFTFPIAGRYRLWVQVERAYTVITVPVVLDVAAWTDSQR